MEKDIVRKLVAEHFQKNCKNVAPESTVYEKQLDIDSKFGRRVKYC